jgi:hypothetical protein
MGQRCACRVNATNPAFDEWPELDNEFGVYLMQVGTLELLVVIDLVRQERVQRIFGSNHRLFGFIRTFKRRVLFKSPRNQVSVL